MANNDQEQDPHRTWSHLQNHFGESLGFCIAEMERAACAAGKELDNTAYRYYMHIRPSIPDGTKGWGAHGRLETERLAGFYTVTSKTSSAVARKTKESSD